MRWPVLEEGKVWTFLLNFHVRELRPISAIGKLPFVIAKGLFYYLKGKLWRIVGNDSTKTISGWAACETESYVSYP